MGRHKSCDKLGKKHQYVKRYPSTGAKHNGVAACTCEKVCKNCSHTKSVEGTYTYKDGRHVRISESFWDD